MGKAKIEVTPELIASTIFGETNVRVTGASFDADRRAVVLQIEGPEVPDAEYVAGKIFSERRSHHTIFEPRGS